MADGNTLDFSWGSIFKIGLALICFYILYLIQDILTLVFFSLIISILFNPVIDFLQKYKVPRVLGTVFIYLFFFFLTGGFIYLTANTFLSEFTNFFYLLPVYFSKAAPFLKDLDLQQFQSFEVFQQYLQSWVVTASANIFSAASTLFGGFFTMITIFTIAIFLSLEGKSVQSFLVLISPKEYENYIADLFSRVENKVAGWFGSRVLSCIFVGVVSYLLLWSFGVKGSLTLAFFAAVTNIIPVAGPLVAGSIIGIFSLLQLDATRTVLILVAFVLIHQVEGNVLTPILTKKLIGIPPVLVMVSLLIGARLWGVLGAVLIIPMAGITYEFLREFLKKRKEEAAG